MQKRIVSFIIALALPIMLSTPAFAATYTTHQLPPSSRTGFLLGRHRRGKVAGTAAFTAENWAGYAVTGNNDAFNSVTSSWTQPSLDCSAVRGNSYSSYWVGLDGFSDSTVEQIGTEADCVRGKASYGAWYEMYPSNPFELSVKLTIHSGDKMTATVSYQPPTSQTTVKHGRTRTTTINASYALTLSDASTKKSSTVNLSSDQSFNRSSAEVIAEAPSNGYGILPLADFSSVNFTDSQVNGSSMGGLPNLDDIIMQNPSGMAAKPSAFDTSSEEDFSIDWSAS